MANQPSKPTPKIVVNRSAKTGEFVSKDYAQKHQSTTEKEMYKRPK